MIVIGSARIPAFVVVIGLTYVLRHEIQVIRQLYVHSGIPSCLLEPCKTIVDRTAEVAPIWLKCKMGGHRRLRYPVINLSTGTKHGGVCAAFDIPCSHCPLSVGECKIPNFVRKCDFRNESPLKSLRSMGCKVHLILKLHPRKHLVRH